MRKIFIILILIFSCESDRIKNPIINNDLDNDITISNIDSLDYYIKKGDSLFYEGKYKTSIKYFSKIIEKDSTISKVLSKRAYVYHFMSETPSALNDVNKAIELDSLNVEALNIKGIILDSDINYNESYNLFKKAIKIDEDYSKSYWRIAQLIDRNTKNKNIIYPDKQILTKKENEKRESLIDTIILLANKAIEKDSSDFKAWTWWADFENRKIFFPEYGQWQRFKKDSARLYKKYKKGLMVKPRKQGDITDKMQFVFKYLHLFVHSKSEFDSINNLLIKLGNKLIELYPENPDSYYNMSYAYYQNSDSLELAETYSDKAEELGKSDELYFESYKYDGIHYPYTYLDENESFRYPIYPTFEFRVEDIKGYSTNKENFYMKFTCRFSLYESWEDYINIKGDTLKTRYNGEEINIKDPNKIIKLNYIKADNTIYNGIEISKDKYSALASFEGDVFHNWDLRDYPFDIQKIKVEFESILDTLAFQFNSPDKFAPHDDFLSFNEKMDGLKAGYKIDRVNFKKKYKEGFSIEYFSPFLSRKTVHEVAEFEINISREGSWLFLKLFLGAFLACLISWMAFLIPNKYFDSQISISVGAIFGAIGNKYFVESTTPAVQVLTKADLLNNLAILIVMLNIFFLVAKKSTKINLGFFEKNLNPLFFSISISIISILFIINF